MRRLLLSTALLLLSACGPSLRLTPGELPPVQPPPADLKQEAEQYVAQHIDEESYREIRSGAEYRRVRQMVDKLSVAAGYPSNTFPVHLLDAGEEVNAAAFNGASIVVYRELLVRVSSDDELATVLGHEVGHIVAAHFKDHEEEKSRAAAVSVGSSLLGVVASVATAAAGYGGAADLAGGVTETATGTIGYGAFVGSFSRTQEYEADHLGLLIMAKAGYDPRAAVQFWERSAEVFGAESSSVGAFFSTHPASRDRQQAIAEAMPHAIRFYEATRGVASKTK
ncbi:MAG: M48 family metallopeptidase [Bdellovibrionales bacterium]|nr:M48 family metallopeptidase [Bdellovibrionales bacterium]